MKDYLRFKDYIATVHYNPEDEVLHGKVYGINDLVTFEGQSVKELKAAFAEAIEDYLDFCKEVGKSPEKTFKGSFNVRVPSSLHKSAAFVALQNKISLNDFVKGAICYAIKHEDEVSKEIFNSY
jgi:predicted HicB family RNase H-like nuclease